MALFSLDNRSMNEITHTSFKLHNHDNYEIYIFISGDTNYIVEGRTYMLEPYDMIIIRRHEMHRAHHNSNTPYKRFVINIQPEFFVENNCEAYERRFKEINSAEGNKICAEIVRSSGIYDVYMRIMKYSRDCLIQDSPVVRAAIIELLYLIDNVTDFSYDDLSNNCIKHIISYINSNYTESITLDDVAEKFFVSKYHLCRKFKAETGMTLHKYIINKRITKVRELVPEGMNISDAVTAAGFNDYSSFYRAYIKEFGISPGAMFK